MPEPIVETQGGKVRGMTLDSGTLAFLGLPYATAARFEAPYPVAPWRGIVEMNGFGAIAPQADPRPGAPGYGIILERMGAPGGPTPLEDEACQSLNIWTANLRPDRLKPVMVWLHPGFFMVGSGASGNGAHLAARGDVVTVSLNHRLNLFGFTHLDDLADGFTQSGNAGMLDILAALTWIHANIERFGGDPHRIMVFGASGGGMKTAWLMASPVGAGLLQRAGVQSGPCLRVMTRDEASAISEELLHLLGLTRRDADRLRTLPVPTLLAAYHTLRTRHRPTRFTHLASFAPVIDPVLLPHQPFSPDALPLSRHIPMLLGWNREDMAFFTGDDPDALTLDDAGLARRVAALLGDQGEGLADTYRRHDLDATPSALWLRIHSDYSIGGAVLEQAARRHAPGSAATFVYRFDHTSPALEGRLGAVHSSETAYVFGTPSPFADRSPEARDLAAGMQEAWTAFAASGDVNAATRRLPSWPAFAPDLAVMRLAAPACLLHDPIPNAAAWAIP